MKDKKEKFIAPATLAKLKRPDLLEVTRQIFEHGNGALAVQTKKDNPALYDALRSDAVTAGLAVARPRDAVAEKRRALGFNEHAAGRAPHNFTPEELAAREEFPLAEATLYYKGTPIGETPRIFTKLRESNPHNAYRLQLAAKSYGLIDRTPVPPAAPEPKPDEPFPLSDSLCDRYSMPRGTLVTSDQYTAIICAYADSELAKKLAEDAAENNSSLPTQESVFEAVEKEVSRANPAPAAAQAMPPIKPPAPPTSTGGVTT